MEEYVNDNNQKKDKKEKKGNVWNYCYLDHSTTIGWKKQHLEVSWRIGLGSLITVVTDETGVTDIVETFVSQQW